LLSRHANANQTREEIPCCPGERNPEILQQVIRQQTILTLLGKTKIRLLVSIIGVAISFALTTLAQQKDAPDPELRQMIDAFAKKYAEAVNNNDAAAIAAFYTEDGIFVTSEGPKYGREAIERFYADLFRQFHFGNYSSKADRYSPHLIGTTGNETLEIGEWSCTVESHGSPVQLKGYYSSIYNRAGNDWKISMVTSNMTQ
jgi:ketosteroid isomerase-like protein